jgi:Tol biopolymer transport system component
MPSTSRIIFATMFLLLCAARTTRADDSAAIADAPDAKHNFGVFTNLEPVTIEGYSQDAMEPFISPDGNYLFFNSSNSAPTTNLYYATRINDVTFQFVGEIGGINTEGPLNAVASMDDNGTFYFVSNRNYVSPTFSTIYSCSFSGGNCSSIAVVPGISKRKLFDINFDACISPDGNTLYFDDGVYSSALQLQRASIAIARRDGGQFKRLNTSAKIMKQINQHGWNYAPDISKSGLEFFFTRFDSSQPGALPTIYTATRSKTSKPFGAPRKIEAITGFAEAPALSPDEKSLYFHLRVSGTYVIYRVTRP